MSAKSQWLVLPDPFPTRVFVDCGIVAELDARLSGELQVVLALPRDEEAAWAERLGGLPWILGSDLFPKEVGLVERVSRRVDLAIDRNAGYYPLSVRHSLAHGFHKERMRPGHPNHFLDSSLTGLLPRSVVLDSWLQRWVFSDHRYVSRALLARMTDTCSGMVVANVQSAQAVPYLNAARRLKVPVVGYVASWDHTVGKGIVSPHVHRYVVQNDVMRDDLVRFHGITGDRIVVTGWPQTDVFHAQRERGAYDALLRSYGLDPARRIVLVAGNTPTNAPYEGRFVSRLVGWAAALREDLRPQLLFRPHPRDREWRDRFGAALDTLDMAVQEPSYTDMDVLATILQHVDCVVANAGTILLDGLVNDRPTVCVLYDEGAPEGATYAALNVTGRHYEELAQSGAFLRATDFAGVVAGIERSLEQPGELAQERRRVAASVVGEVDGRAAQRVADAIVTTVESGSA